MKRKTFLIIAVVLLCITVIVVAAPILLQGNYHYRVGFAICIEWLLILSWFAFGVYAFSRLIKAAYNRIRSIPLKVAAIAGSSISILALCALFGFWIVIFPFTVSETEKEVFDNGTIFLTRSYWFDEDEPGSHELYVKKIGPIFYRELTEEEERALGISQPIRPTKTTAPAKDSEPVSATEPSQPTPSLEELRDAELREEISAIYEYLVTEGEIEGIKTASVDISYNAKGVIYAVFMQTRSGQYRVDYDRESANGECDVFVYSYLPADADGVGEASMLNTFAVNRQTREVSASGKNDWGEAGAEDYVRLTGE